MAPGVRHQLWTLAVVVLMGAAPLCAVRGEEATSETAAQRDARMSWWRDARFGMFIHWGVYAVPAGVWDGHPSGGAGEWIMNDAHIPLADYEALPTRFNPVQFDAEQWAKTAADAGMKYLVITSKHHDGFCMFDTKQTNYNIVAATPWHKDPLAALSAACRKYGIRFCVYYSIMDWHSPDQLPAKPDPRHPEYNPTHFAPGKKDAYIAYMKAQLKELITQYRPGLIWFDGQWMGGWTAEDGRDLYRYLRRLDPELITNDRVSGAGDFGTPEQTIPATGLSGRDWETCMTMNDTWGFKADDADFKSAQVLIRNLIDIASKGGNYLLNVGPTAEGTIPEPEVQRLQAMGKWLKTNGKAIYGTSASPFRRLPFEGRCTRAGDTLYVHVFTWPAGGVRLEGVQTPLRSARFLDGAEADASSATNADGRQVITIKPPANPDPVATVVALTFASPPHVEDLSAVVHPAANGVLTCSAPDADVHGATARYESGGGKDNIGFWTDAADYVTWDVQVPAAGVYNASVVYACTDDAAGSEYTLEAGGGTKVAGKVAATGGWANFKTVSVGRIHLSAGKQTLAVRATSMPHGAVMNLKQVVLTPAGRAQ